MPRLRPLAAFLALIVAVCLLGLWSTHSQTGGLRRVTTTTEEGININPSLSGDGRRIAFESTEDLAHAGGTDHFRALRADISSDPAVFTQMAGTRAPAPGISQDGSRIAFAAKDDPLGTNSDGNSEIFLYDGATLRQITNTTPADASTRIRDGNFQPSLTDDGRFIAFSSNRNLANQNTDGNLEIFIYDTATNTFTQLTNTSGTVGASDAKISGDGTRVAYIRDNGTTTSAQRDLVIQDRTGGNLRVLASNVLNLVFTYGRAISDDGSRVVYAADVATDSSQVFLFDGRTTNTTRQITTLGVRTTEVPLHPTISGDGTRIAFATRRTVTGISNSDNSIELYTYDIPTGQFARVTNAPSSADGFDGSSRVAEVVSSLNDDGSIVAFNFPRSLSGTITSGLENDSEIYVTGTAARPTVGTLTVLNGASFGNEPSTTKAVAPNSIAVAQGGALSFTTEQAQKQADGSFPTTVGGTTVTVNGRRAQIFFVSPTQVNFLVPPQTEIGTADVIVTNSEGFQSRANVTTLKAAPGIFTTSGNGVGEGTILNADTLQPGPFDPTNGNLRLIIYTTGVRNATQVTATAGGRALTVESFIASPDMVGLDEVHVKVPADLRGAGTVDVVVRADGRDSNSATVTFSGDACREIVINEVLADPPDGTAGDANLDGVRSGSDDEFVELVNTTSSNIDISGYQLLTRSSTATSDTVRHTFPAGTLFPAGSAIVIFGGGNFNPNNAAFGGAQVFKASSGGLSLNNSGGSVTLRQPSGVITNIFSYGGSTGLDGDTNQSLTRSPDAGGGTCGQFVPHTTAAGSGGRPFSPGTHVDGSPFALGVSRLSSVTIQPPSASVTTGQTTQFTAQGRDQFNRPMTNVTITFVSDNTSVATVESVSTDSSTGIATATVKGRSAGTAHITARATDGTNTVTSSQATLTVNEPPPVVTRVDVSPASPTINRGQTQAFTATAFDQNNQPIANVSFSWSSSNTNVATVNANGLSTGVGIGTTTITATTTDATGATISGTATLTVQVPLVINEILADPPDGLAGDANRDGVRDADDDEFVELVNNSSAAVDISGVIVADSTSNRFTFPANTTLTAGRAVVIFGGGSPPANDPAFGGALIFTTSTLSLGNTADTVNVKLTVGGTDVSIASQTYGAEGNDNQSLTRSPDLTGAFAKHSVVANSDGRLFSPGTRTDGTPFGSPAITRIEITPSQTAVNVGGTKDFTARAFSNTSGTEVEVQNVSFVWDSSDPTKATVSPATGQMTTATALASGSTTIRARAGSQQGTASLIVNPTLSINDVSANEGNSGTTTFTFTVSLSQPAPTGGVTFNIATQDGTATVADNDYVAKSLTSQTIPAGQQTYTFNVTVNGDTVVEPNETFLVNVTNVSGASIADGQGTGTILNDDSPSLSINDVSANEGNSGTTVFTFTVSSTLPAPAGGITFDIATADGTATVAGNDYVAKSLTAQTIPAGQQTYTFNVTVNGDTLVEANETFTVNITNASGASISDGQGVGTIQNDDAAQLVISQLYVGGGNSGATYSNDFVELFNSGTTTVDFSQTPYSIQYVGTTGSFGSTSSSNKTNITSGTIAPGHYLLVQEASGGAVGVALPTADATGSINMSATSGKVALVAGTAALPAFTCPGDDGSSPFNPANSTIADFVGYGGTSTTTGTCYEGTGPAPTIGSTTADFRKAGGCVDTNDNAADFLAATPNPRNSSTSANDCSAGLKPEITINDVSVTEGDTGTKTVDFTVTLSTSSTLTVNVDYATADGTATAGNDYQSTSGTLSFAPSETTKHVTVTIIGDTLDEPNETFFVNLSNATNATILDNQGQGTITDNDAAPSISINDVSVAEGDTGTTNANFTVTLSAASGQTVTVNYVTADGTATAGSDYTAASGTVTFTPGQTQQTISVTVNGDTTFEPNETFFVNLNTPTNATISDTQGQGTITNDDPPPVVPSLSINDVSITEGDSGTKTLTFTVSLSPSSSQTVTVAYATADGTATAGSDYQSTSGTLSFAPGDTSKPVNVTINGDTTVEPDETFFVNLSNAANAPVIDSQGIGTIQNDDTALVVISQVYGGGGNTGATYTNDFIEVFNRGTTTVDLTGWSVQENTATGTGTWSVTPLCATGPCLLAPGQYFLVQEAAGAGGTQSLPTPDATGTINLSGTAGKVALVSNTTALSGSCPTGASILDTVGYGSSATCFEGAGPAPAPSNTTADLRVNNGCTDTNNNSTDFATGAPNPRNTSTPLHNCSFPDLTINDVSVTEGNSGTVTASFTVQLSAPAPAGGVTFDIATQDGTATTADNDYVAKSLTSQTIPAGSQTYSFDVTVNGDTNIEANETFFVNVTNVSRANVVDSQGQGTIQNDDSPTLSINDVSAAEGNAGTTTFTFTVSLSQPAQAGGVTFDIATADGTATTANNDYVAKSLTSQTIPAGQQTYTFDVTVNGDTTVEPDETFTVNVTNVSGANLGDGVGQGTIQNDDTANVVISQIYQGGGLTNAVYKNDFVELFNRGTTTVDFSVTPYSVQFLSTGGSTWAKTDITSGTLAPGRYFLIQEASGGSTGATLPTADATGSINLTSTTPGKVALVVGTTLLTGNCPGDDGMTPFNPVGFADFVGYGGTASTANHCYEGTGPATYQTSNNTIADFRKAGGCTDTNDNFADFFTSTPSPRNTASAVNSCSGGTTPNLSIDDVSVTEGNSGTVTATFTVSLSAPAQGTDVTFDIATADNTATVANNDYVAKSLTNQIIPAGQQTYTFSVTVNGDTNVEPTETFNVNVTNVSGANVTDGQGVGTITNDDFPTLSINDVSQNEGNSGATTFTFTVSLSAPAPAPVTFDIATADGTATTADNDYVARSLTSQTISTGQQTYTFDVTVNGDTTVESSETFFVNVSNVSGATVSDGQGQGTIQNDDSPQLTINDVSQSEGNSGTTTFTFTVSLSQPAPASGVTFDIATADGTATTAGNDYVAKSLTSQTITSGNQTYTFDVSVNGDMLVEPNETFFVNVTNVTGATVVDGQGQGTIQNDDTANLVISQVYGGGNNTGAQYQNDFVELFNRGTTTVDFSVTPYSVQYASVGSNFGTNKTNLMSGTIAPGRYFLVQESGGTTNGIALPTPDATGAIAMGNTSGKVALVLGTTALSANACPGDDGSSPFNVNDSTVVDFVGYGNTATTTGHCYEGAGPAAAPSNTTSDFRKAGGCTDTNNNSADFLVSAPFPRNTASPVNNCSAGTPPNLTINDVTAAEGNSGTTTFTFTVSLSAPAPSTDVFFDIATQNGTATSGSDYVAKALTNQVIPAGQQTYTFSVTVNGDTTVEPDETFNVNVTNVVGANVTDGQGVGTIQNDDNPQLTINDVSLNEGNSSTTTFTFTVSLSAASASPVTFDIATADGTATTADNDYVANSLTNQSIPAGQQTYTFNVTVNGDTNVEPNETFFVNVTNVSGATVTDGQGQGTIQNDDVTPALSISDVSQAEGNSGTTNFMFTVSLTSPAGPGGVSFSVNTADGTATAPGDYTAITNGVGSIAQGNSSTTVTVQVNGDTTVEPDETFFVNISNVTGATVNDSQGQGTITNDDSVATSADLTVSKTDSPDPVAIGNDITYTITVTNSGPDAAANAQLSDTVPTNTTFRSITPPAGWTCPTQPAQGGTGAISCTNPSFAVGSAVFTLVVRVNTSATNNSTISNTVSVSSSTNDPTNNNSATETTTVKQPLLVISQVYGGGGLTGATYKNDFIEIFNAGKVTVDFSVTPYSVQYADATNSFTTLKTDITSGTIAPGQYFLIQESSGGATGSTLPTADATGAINLNANSGKVALVLGTTALSGTCPGDDGVAPFNPAGNGVVDFLGYGFGASTGNPNCFEGSARATTASATANARSIMRTASCTDTNDNAADFTYTNSTGTSPPVARNSATTKTPCP